jgi:hypothetical protein
MFTSNLGLVHWKALLRVLGYLYATTDGIDVQGYSRGFLPMTESDAYVDACFAGDVDTRRSTTDYVVQVENGAMKERHSLYVDDLLIA